MPNQISKDKQRQTFVLPKELVARLSGRAAQEKTTKTAVVQAALEAYLQPTEPPVTRADLEAIAAKLEAMEAADETRAAALASAIANQPVAAVERAALPDPDAWKSKTLWQRIRKR